MKKERIVLILLLVSIIFISGCTISKEAAETLALDKVKATFRDSYKTFALEIDPTSTYIQDSEVNSAINELYVDSSFKDNEKVWNVIIKSSIRELDDQIIVKVYDKETVVLPDGMNNNLKNMLNFFKKH